ncbi:MAG: hypothetical protein CL840_04460 [Crocinitomicaceae bacterium]|nr:hypothetical protein [Crocinitomicaceae bacterium]|tara:strand:- start:304 stop:690 length:387 start_codon:yes stop_codon:yes gene_type:complete
MTDDKAPFTLESVNNSSIELQDKMREFLSEKFDLQVSQGSFSVIFSGCFLPMKRFQDWPDTPLPSDMEKDIVLWFFMRFLGRKPKLNILGEFDAIEAEPFADAIINATQTDDWQEQLFNPLDCGYLPY